jgi:hypothetical protein
VTRAAHQPAGAGNTCEHEIVAPAIAGSTLTGFSIRGAAAMSPSNAMLRSPSPPTGRRVRSWTAH